MTLGLLSALFRRTR